MPGCTGDFGIVVAGYKPPGTLGIARCQSHLRVLWETKHSWDLWEKHSTSIQRKQELRANSSEFAAIFDGLSWWTKCLHSQHFICPSVTRTGWWWVLGIIHRKQMCWFQCRKGGKKNLFFFFFSRNMKPADVLCLLLATDSNCEASFHQDKGLVGATQLLITTDTSMFVSRVCQQPSPASTAVLPGLYLLLSQVYETCNVVFKSLFLWSKEIKQNHTTLCGWRIMLHCPSHILHPT